MTEPTWAPQAEATQPPAKLAMAAFWLLLHWQALSSTAQLTFEAAEAIQLLAQVGTAAIAEAQGLPAEQEGPAVTGPPEAGGLEEAGGAGPPVDLDPAEEGHSVSGPLEAACLEEAGGTGGACPLVGVELAEHGVVG